MSKLKKEATHGYVSGPTYHKITDKQTGTVVAVNVREGYAELFEKSPELQEQVAALVAALEDIARKATRAHIHSDDSHDSWFADIDAVAKAALAKHQEEEVKPYESFDEVLEDITGINPKPQEEN